MASPILSSSASRPAPIRAWSLSRSLQQTPLVLVADGAVLILSPFADAQDERLLLGALELDLDLGLFLSGIARRGHADDLVEALEGLELRKPPGAFAVAARDQVAQPPRTELLEVLLERHAAVDDDHLPAAKAAHARFERVEHRRQACAVLGVAVEDLVCLGEAVAVDDQTDDHLLAVGALVARVAALGAGIGQRLTFEVRGGQVVEEDGLVEVEQLSLALDEVGFDECTLGVEPVHVAIQRRLRQGGEVGAEQLAQGGASHPRRHRMLGSRRNQSVHHHRAGQLPGALAQARALQRLVESHAIPKRQAHVDGTRFAHRFHRDPLGVDADGGTGRAGATGAGR